MVGGGSGGGGVDGSKRRDEKQGNVSLPRHKAVADEISTRARSRPGSLAASGENRSLRDFAPAFPLALSRSVS